MYPTLSDILRDLFGIKISLPIQSFGMMMATSFIVAAWLLMKELKRKEADGTLKPTEKKVLKGKPASISELLISGAIGFIVGFKLIGIVINYTAFSNNPQTFIFSSQGTWVGGFLMMGLSIFLRYREKEKERKNPPVWETEIVHPYQLTGNIILLGALFGILGAKIFHNLENIDEFIKDPVDAIFSFSGLTYYGGLIMAAIAIIYFVGKYKIKPLTISDIAAPSIMSGYGIGRIGCQLAGDGDWGIVNTAPKPNWMSFLPDWMWSFKYPHNVINEGIKIPGCDGKHCFELAQAVYPTPIYETLMCLGIVLILWILRKRLKTPGVLFSIFLILTGLERFLIETIRVNNKFNVAGISFTQAELISVVLILIGLFGIWYLQFRKPKKIAENESGENLQPGT